MESLSVGVGRKWRLFNALHGMHLVALNQHTYETRTRVRNAQMGMPVQTSGGWAQWYKHERDFSMAGSVARKRELCPISIAAPGAAPLVYHVFIVGAWLPGRTRDVNLHFLASYAESRSVQPDAANTRRNKRDRKKRRPVFACLLCFTILREKDECATSLEAPYRRFRAFRLSPILFIIPRQVSVIKILRPAIIYTCRLVPRTCYLNEDYISRMVRF